MIAQHFSFVKNFFQVFSNFFVLSSAGSRRHHSSSLADDLIRIPQALRFVKHFFQAFQTSFSAQLSCSLVVSTLFRKVFALSQSACLYQQTLSRLSTPFFSFFHLSPPFVKLAFSLPFLYNFHALITQKARPFQSRKGGPSSIIYYVSQPQILDSIGMICFLRDIIWG